MMKFPDSTNKNLVVIVGSGPTGLSLAVELGMRSIPCLIIEKDKKRGFAPRAKTTHVRTRELMRRWGIADELAAASPFGIDYPTHIHFVTKLNGYSLVRFPNALYCSPQRDERYSEHGQWLPQYTVEKILKAKALSLPGVEIQYGKEFVGFEEVDEKVAVRIRSTTEGTEEVITADFLVGADGARSSVRDAIGAQMLGTYGLSRNYNIIFRAPGLAEAHPHGPGIMFWMLNTVAPGTIGPMDKGDLWYFGPTHISEGVTLSDEKAVDLIKQATGIDLPYEIVSSDVWVANRLLADRYRKGRAFLAGDACHLHPPYGGYGMNMGVSDAVDLGWKIAAVLQGWGSDTLLESYEVERRAIHGIVLDEAEGNHSVLANQLFREGIEDDTPEGEVLREEVSSIIRQAKEREFYALGIILGLRYRGSPVIFDDGTESGWKMSREYEPSAAPGCLAPHAWLDDECSLYDLFGENFTLLVFADCEGADIAAAQTDAEIAGVPLKIVKLPNKKLSDLYEASRALIRPDQFVAWRGDHWLGSGLLQKVTGQKDPVTSH